MACAVTGARRRNGEAVTAPVSTSRSGNCHGRFHAPGLQVPLTAREEDILACLAQGLQYKEIPDRLNISMALVKKLQQRIFHKLGVHSRTLAVNQWHKLS
jgi:DNA-binding CsgD family transcriptional regulator